MLVWPCGPGVKTSGASILVRLTFETDQDGTPPETVVVPSVAGMVTVTWTFVAKTAVEP